MDVIKHYLSYAVLIAIFWAAVIIVPKCSRVTVPENYNDIAGMEPYTGYTLDTSVTLAQLRRDDAICFRLGASDDKRINFGWIAALPGDQVSIVAGFVHVNGEKAKRGGEVNLPSLQPLVVPANFLYVISESHQFDSVAEGPLPAIALRGRIEHLP
jgi:hypothetical protein